MTDIDAGLPMACSHPKDDYRPVIADLCAKVDELAADNERLRAELAEVRESARYYSALVADRNAAMVANLSNHLAVVRALCDQYKDAPPPIFRGPDLSEHGKGYSAGARDMARAVLGTLTEVTS